MRTAFAMGVRVDLMSLEESVDTCVALMRRGVPSQHVVVNAAKVVLCAEDPELASIVNESALVNADGMAVVWAFRLLGAPVPERVTGIDLMESLLEACAREDLSVYLLGATSDVLARFIASVKDRFPTLRIVGSNNGYYADERAIVEQIAEVSPDLLLVAMPTPRKEHFVAEYLQALNASLVVGVGGSFDVWAGETSRAPRWMQHAGLEWVFRLAQEPGRMWKRYLIGNTRFILMFLAAMVSGQKAFVAE